MRDQPITWESAQTLLAVVEQGSFSGAAKTLALGQPTVSRRIAQLEHALGEQLFRRGKHGADPTDTTLRLLPAAQQMARWASEFQRNAESAEQQVSGLVTIAAPPGVAVAQLAPFAARLSLQQPQLRLEIRSAVAHLDLSRGEADIAIRTQEPNEPELMAVVKAQAQPLVVASPDYVASLVPPCRWADLGWITWSHDLRHVAPRPMLEQAIPNFTPRFTSDDYLVQKAAAQAGLGAFVMGMPQAALDSAAVLASEGLVEVPMQVRLPVAEFYVVCAKSARQIPRVRVVLDALVEAVSGAVG